jgi:hypothetical protein
MKLPEGFQFNCGNCAWCQIVEVPKEKKKDYPIDRGYCTFNPPSVFPMPQQTSSLKNIKGESQMGFAPFMLRPVVEANEPACGRYSMDGETMELLGVSQGGCGKGESCGCMTAKECNCVG